MGYRDRKASSSVERFMKHYYLVAKEVGALTRIFCAALEEQQRRRPRLGLARFGLGRRRIGGMVVQGGRIAPATPDLFEREPIAMLELFQLAQERDLDIHPGGPAGGHPEPAAGRCRAARGPRGQRAVPQDADRAQGPGDDACGG